MLASSIGDEFSLGVPMFTVITLHADGSVTSVEENFEQLPALFTVDLSRSQVVLMDPANQNLITYELDTCNRVPSLKMMPFPRDDDILHSLAFTPQGEVALNLRRHDENGELSSSELRTWTPGSKNYAFVTSHPIAEGVIETIAWRPDGSALLYEVEEESKSGAYIATRNENQWIQGPRAYAPANDPIRYVWLPGQLVVLTSDDEISVFDLTRK